MKWVGCTQHISFNNEAIGACFTTTINGAHVKIGEGESKGEAAKKFIKKKGGDPAPAKAGSTGGKQSSSPIKMPKKEIKDPAKKKAYEMAANELPDDIKNIISKQDVKQFSSEEINKALEKAKEKAKKSPWYNGSQGELIDYTMRELPRPENRYLELKKSKSYQEISKKAKEGDDVYGWYDDIIQRAADKVEAEVENNIKSQIAKHLGVKYEKPKWYE